MNLINKRKEINQKYNKLGKDLGCEVKGYRYILMKGNNHPLVKRVMETRSSWVKIPHSSTTLFDFKWTPTSNFIKFDFLNKHGQKTIVNHFEFHSSITQKDTLYQNMAKHCEVIHKCTFDFLPVTFVIDYTSKYNFENAFEQFQIYFNVIERNKESGINAIN